MIWVLVVLVVVVVVWVLVVLVVVVVVCVEMLEDVVVVVVVVVMDVIAAMALVSLLPSLLSCPWDDVPSECVEPSSAPSCSACCCGSGWFWYNRLDRPDRSWLCCMCSFAIVGQLYRCSHGCCRHGNIACVNM